LGKVILQVSIGVLSGTVIRFSGKDGSAPLEKNWLVHLCECLYVRASEPVNIKLHADLTVHVTETHTLVCLVPDGFTQPERQSVH